MIVGWVVAVLLMLAAAFLVPLARVTSPPLAVALASDFGLDHDLEDWVAEAHLDFARSAADEVVQSPAPLTDPWGRPWRMRRTPFVDWELEVVLQGAGWAYSTGPDGVDDLGSGDDVFVEEAATFDGGLIPDVVQRRAGGTLVGLAVLLGLYTTVAWLIVPSHRRSRSDEALLAGGLALPWVMLTSLWMVLLLGSAPATRTAQRVEEELALRVPATWATIGTVALASFSLALAWRLTRPRSTP